MLYIYRGIFFVVFCFHLSAARHLSFLIECGNNGARLSGAFDVGDGGRLFSWQQKPVEGEAKRPTNSSKCSKQIYNNFF